MCLANDALNTVNTEIYTRIFFVNNIKIHICHIKNLRLVHDLPTSVNGVVTSPFRESFISEKLCICEVS